MTVRIKNRGLPAVLRTAVLVLLFLYITMVSLAIFSNLRSRNRQISAVDQSVVQSGPANKNFRILEFAGEKRRLSLKADNFFTDEEGRQYLEGQVEINDEELDGGVQLQASRVVIDRTKQLLRAEGGVKIEFGELRMQAPLIEYELKEKEARAEKARIERGPLRLATDTMLWLAGPGEIILEGNITGEKIKPGDSFSFECNQLSLHLERNKFSAENLKLRSGHLWLSASLADVRLKEESMALTSITLSGQAEARWAGSSARLDFRSFRLRAEKLIFLAEDSGLTLLARPGFWLDGSGKEWQIRMEGETLEVLLESGQAARRLHASQFLARLKGKQGQDLEFSAGSLDYDPITGEIELKGKPRACHQDYRLEAFRLGLSLPEFRLIGSDFDLEIKPGFFKEGLPFFEKELPVLMSGSRLETGRGVFELGGGVRAWQEEDFCLAGKVRLDRDKGLLRLQNLEKASWSIRRNGGQEERLDIRAGRAELLSESGRVNLSEGVELRLDRLKLQGEEVSLNLSGGIEDRLARLEAQNRVRIDWKEYQATGRQAFLDFDSQQLLLTGRPKLRGASGERLEGDKLTLFLADDRIRLENQGRERSLTVLVREK